MRRIGVDVGGTNTDAALLEGADVVATAKASTTQDTVSGIVHSLQLLSQKVTNGLNNVQAVMLGTTQFVNAVIEQKSLSKVFVVRLCGTATAALPPFTGIPAALLSKISAGYLLASGGYEYDGATEISPLQAAAHAAAAAEHVLQAGAAAVAVCGVHAPMNPSQELVFVAQLTAQLQQRAPGHLVHISMSHQLSGRLGLLEREAATILNASLQPLAAAVVPQYSAALQQVGLQAVPLYLTGNDGTLLPAAAAQALPVLTFKSGPVNSVRGAAYLAAVSSALVCDIGGTTTDIGAVVKGAPRMCGAFVDICGICTNFQMPDVTSFGLGGGSLVEWDQQQCLQDSKQPEEQQQQQRCCVGPLSVGSALTSSSLVCGGDQITASDVAVLLHDRLPDLASKQAAEQLLTLDRTPNRLQLQAAWDTIQQMLAKGIDAAKPSAEPTPLVVVGGAVGLCGDELPGISSIIRPPHADVANAIGAAIPQVAGTVNTLLHLTAANWQQQLAAAVQQATAAAVAAGADPESCDVAEIEEIPVAYGSAGAVRVHVKVAGKLRLHSPHTTTPRATTATEADIGVVQFPAAAAAAAATAGDAQQPPAASVGAGAFAVALQQQQQQPACSFDVSAVHAEPDAYFPQQQYSQQYLQQYKPYITAQGLWAVSSTDLDAMAVGAQVLGAGGGGSARHNRLKLEHAMRAAQTTSCTAAADAALASRIMPTAACSGTSAAAAAAVRVPFGGDLLQQQQQQRGSGSSSTTAAALDSSSNSSNVPQASLAPQQQQQSDIPTTALPLGHHASPLIMALADLPDNAFVCDVGGMGAPTVSAEKLDSFECVFAVQGLSKTFPTPITALLCAEVGGGNAIEPLAVGLQLQLPVVDADLMGRAFPELQMSTAAIAGVSLTPAAIADDKGNVLVMQRAASPNWAEKVLRSACTEMGCTVGLASSPMAGKTAKQVVVPGSLSLAWRMGMAVLHAQAAKSDPVAAVLQLYQGTGRLVFEGKVVDVVRRTEAGFVRGQIRIQCKQQQANVTAKEMQSGNKGLQSSDMEHQSQQPQHDRHFESSAQHETPPGSDSDCLVIEFQNENLVARLGPEGAVVGCVPDLICVLESSTGQAVATEDVRYGLWVSVLVLPAHPLLRTPAALEVVGPAAFGYAADRVVYQPVGPYPEFQTVHEICRQ